MKDTPRTDAETWSGKCGEVVPAEFARELEREINEFKCPHDELKILCDKCAESEPKAGRDY
jgi:hypothetical protein